MNKDYYDLIATVVCDLNTKICMIHRCEHYPGNNGLREYLKEISADHSEDEEISFHQWQGTDRTMLYTQTKPFYTFVTSLLIPLQT